MRKIQLLNKIVDNWIYLVYIVFTSGFLILSTMGKKINPIIGVLAISISGILTYIDRINSDDQGSKKSKILNENIEEQKKLIIEMAKEKKMSKVLLNNLINKGLIEQEELFEHMPSSDIYSLFCFPTPLAELKINDKKYSPPNRQYPVFLKDIGFVRVNRFSTVFVTTPRRLTKSFRNIPTLKDYLSEEIDKSLEEYWKLYLNGLKKYCKNDDLDKDEKSFFSRYYNLKKDISHDEILKFSIAIVRGKLDEKNLGCLYKSRTYSKDFEELLKEEVDLRYIDLPKERKIKIRKIMLDSSIELFFYGIEEKDLEEIKSIETKLKEELRIAKFTDYLDRSSKDMARIFLNIFPEEKANVYIKFLKKKIREYDKALKDLGISI